MSSRTRRPSHEVDDFKKEFEQGLDALDTQRLQSLERMRAMQQVETEALAREHERLTAKYGGEHRRVQHLADQLDYSRSLVQSLDLEIEKARINVPEIDEKQALVHGRVLRPNRRGIPDLTVWFVDAEHERIDMPGHTCTDERGYFAVCFPEARTDDRTLFLRLSDASGRVLHRSTDAVTPEAGRIVYIEVVLGEKDCPPPPDEDPAPPEEGIAPKILRLSKRPAEPRVGEEVRFSASVEGTPPLKAAWTFGDGEKSEDEKPVHAYAEPGEYVATLEVSNAFGSDTAETTVPVKGSDEEPPTDDNRPPDEQGTPPKILRLAKRPAEPLANEEVLFFASLEGTAPLKTVWIFGDGEKSEEEKPRHAFKEPGEYVARLKVSNAFGSDAAETSVTVKRGGGTPGDNPVRPSGPIRRG